jgi:NADPH-dependent 2,4-dienoyl-CoA reductase/sulfur reductase-like enzyme
MSATFDLVIIGAGPAGMGAAITATSHGLSTLVLDEQQEPGGQIYRAIAHAVDDDGAPDAGDKAHGKWLTRAFLDCGATYQPGQQVWQIEEGGTVYTTDGAVARRWSGARLLLATGAMERPVPIPGWTLPGVMTVGAAQILHKTARWTPAEPLWIAGSGPLLLLYAAQLLHAGEKIAGILDTTPADNRRAAFRHVWGALRNAGYLLRGRSLIRRIESAGVRVVRDVSGLEALGEGELKSVRWRVGDIWSEELASTLLLHHGVVPQTHMAASIGCALRWDELQCCHVPAVDVWGNTSVDAVAVAGDGAGIGGARMAEQRGRLAALEAARALGKIKQADRDDLARSAHAELDRHRHVRPFLDAMYRPRDALLVPGDDVVVCRCEHVTAREIRDCVDLGCMGVNQMKAFTRCGMGPCQGRMCGLAAAQIVAAARGVSPGEIELFRARPPLKSISMGELAALDDPDTSVLKHAG